MRKKVIACNGTLENKTLPKTYCYVCVMLIHELTCISLSYHLDRRFVSTNCPFDISRSEFDMLGYLRYLFFGSQYAPTVYYLRSMIIIHLVNEAADFGKKRTRLSQERI